MLPGEEQDQLAVSQHACPWSPGYQTRWPRRPKRRTPRLGGHECPACDTELLWRVCPPVLTSWRCCKRAWLSCRSSFKSMYRPTRVHSTTLPGIGGRAEEILGGGGLVVCSQQLPGAVGREHRLQLWQ